MNRLSLENVEWGEFYIGGKIGLFDITSTSSGIDKNKLNQSEGNIPYITRSEENNGINLFVSDEQHPKYQKDMGGVITIGLDTQTVFYQPQEFYTGQNIQILKNENLSKYSALFIIPLLKIQMEKFNWGGNGATLTRLKRTKLVLPVDSKGNPDWQFMENYVKQEMKTQSQRVVSYYENKLLKLGGGVLNLEVDWKEFEIKDVFETFVGTNGLQVPTGSYIKKSELEPSEIPRITVKETNNGIDNYGFSKDKNFRVFENFISVSFLGGVFYHPYKASIDMKVHALIPENVKLDEYNANFLINSIKNNIKHSSYGNQLSSTDLPRVKIMLPTDKNGNPNWQYMSNLVKKLEKENIDKVLEHIYIYIYIYLIAQKLKKQYSFENAVWREYFIEDICEVKSGVRLTKTEQKQGKIPFIGAVDNNNGVTEFIGNVNNSLDKNILGINYNGSVVETFYHPYEGIFSDDVKRVSFIDKSQNNEYSLLFLKQMIIRQKSKYQYGYKFNGKRMNRQKIILPAKNDGSPDYDFMKKYMMIQEIFEIRKILEFY